MQSLVYHLIGLIALKKVTTFRLNMLKSWKITVYNLIKIFWKIVLVVFVILSPNPHVKPYMAIAMSSAQLYSIL